MDKLYYTAIFERDRDGYSVFFPDLPGCTSGGSSIQDAAANAETALALHISGIVDDGEMIDWPSNPETIERDPEVTEAARMLIGVTPQATKVRVNVMLDVGLVAAIDAHADNRSRFLVEAARDKLRGMIDRRPAEVN